VETALSGAGGETTASQPVQARELVDRRLAGLGSYGLMTVAHSPTTTRSNAGSTAIFSDVQQTLRADAAVTTVVALMPGVERG
jgi:putative drug exporter of the RND superfamily